MEDQPLPPSPGHTQTDVREPGGRADAPRPRDLGHYRLLRLLGEGGMGEVWLADQLEPVLRQVAVKVIKAGMDTRRVVARFEAERQALALMSHPAIASVLDGGSTPEGRPYFVMEYIEGVSLTEHCDRQQLSAAARLELLIEVCAGVQHAHQKAIVHRDLKPSNILVTKAEGRAQPKIIDFGIAKAIGEAGELESRHTALGAVIGTAAYMSPEQADPTAPDVDTRTDVYSLGVILYELLTGELPFGGGQGPPSQEDQRRKLSGESPPRPSARLLATPGTGEAARARGTDPAALRRLLEGDLDAIALKALERDRARRYGTPTELAADLQRYLRREPVLAQPPSAAYRARKYVERHRTAVTAAAALVVALVGGVVVSAWQAQRARAAERRAEAEAAVARATSDFLENDLLGQADVAHQAGGKPDPDLKVRTLLDRAAARVEGSFAGQPALEGSLRTTIGDAYLGLGLLAEARAQLDRAVAVSEGALGPDAPTTLRARAALARLALAQSRPAEAEALSLDTLERLRRVLGPEHRDTLQSLVVLASARYAQGHYPEAEAGLTQALELQRRVLGPEHRETLYTMMKLGSTYSVQSRQPEAEALYRQTLELQRRVLGPEHPDTLRTANSLGTVCMYQEEYAAAEAVLAPLVEIERRVLGPQHPQTLLSLMSLGALYHDTGKLEQAEAAMVEASAIQRQVLGPAHLDTLGGLLSLGELYCTEGRYREAESTLAGALESLRQEKPSSMYLLYAMGLMADVHAAAGRFAQAEALGEEALAAWRKTKGPEHRDLLLELVSQALRADLPLGKYARARTRLEEALGAQRRTLGPEHRETLVTLDTLARLARAEGRYGEARVQYADVLERRRRTLGEDNLSVLESGEGLALTDFLDGQREASAARLGQVLEARRRRQGTRIPAALQTLADQAMALEATGSFSAAEPLAREALAGERAVRPEHWRRFFAQSVLGAALWGQKRYAEAAPLLREGVAGLEARREQVGVPDRFRVERARAWLARLR